MTRSVFALTVVLTLMVGLGQAAAQPPGVVPPDRWHPYQGGTNCIQVADKDGFFNCSANATIDPATGVLVLTLGGPMTTVLGPIVIAPNPLSFQALGNDIVIVKSSTTAVAPAGPGVGALTLRVRPSTRIPGYCSVVAIAGNAFGVNMEFPLAFLNPAYAFLAASPSGGATFFDYYVTDIPGGPGGC